MLQKIIEIAHQAGDAILKYYTDDIEVTSKDDDSPLTKADLAAHHIIVDALRNHDPTTPVISEESGVPDFEDRKEWTKFWIVDPLDGTKEFIKKNGEFTVNIALVEKGIPVLGVVYLPAKKITYYASRETGAWKINGKQKPRRIYSDPANLDQPLTVIQSRSHGSDDLAEKLAEMDIKLGKVIRAGSSLKFCKVAEGEADIYPRMGPTREWDVAAGDCVYRYSARQGVHYSPLNYNKPNLLNDGFLIGTDNSNFDN